jgi:Gti1/Pac2 family transcription factor
MRRWTDGKSWSASRVSGSFLTYREMEGKRGGNNFAPPVTAPQTQAAQGRNGKTPDSQRWSDSDMEMGEDGPDGYRYKPDGLMKQSFSITTANGQHLHLISYYARSHPTAQGLIQPTNDPMLNKIRPQKGMYPESTVHEQQNVPMVSQGPVNGGTYSPSPHSLPAVPTSSYPTSGVANPIGYGWPPTPMSTPPTSYPSGLYGSATQLPPPSINATSSPSQYGQHNPPQTSSAPTMSIFERPPPTSESSLPRPPPPPAHRGTIAHYHQPPQQLPQYVANPSPRVAQSVLIAQQQGQYPQTSAPPSFTTAPRYMSPLASTKPAQPMTASRTPPALEKWDNGLLREPASSGGSIPSVGSLMMGNCASENTGSQRSDTSRLGSRSPGGSQKNPGVPQDIPSEKLGFREDMRALRVLDRVFAA